MLYTTNINTKLLSKTKVVSNATGFPVQFNKVVVGKNAMVSELQVLRSRRNVKK